jgi:hypothetical protein
VQVGGGDDLVGSALIPGIQDPSEVIRDASAIRRLATSRTNDGLGRDGRRGSWGTRASRSSSVGGAGERLGGSRLGLRRGLGDRLGGAGAQMWSTGAMPTW